MLIANREAELTPLHPHRLDPPRRARITASTYGGDTVTLDLDVVWVARDAVCVRQTAPGWPEWLAWIPAGDAIPLTP